MLSVGDRQGGSRIMEVNVAGGVTHGGKNLVSSRALGLSSTPWGLPFGIM